MTRPLRRAEIAKLSAAAARKQRWRERRRAGRFVVPIEVSAELLDRLTGVGLLVDERTYNREYLAADLLDLLEQLGHRRRP